jgi:hypothetical protein
MHEGAIGRRTFLAGAAALTASGALVPGEGRAQVPNSSGTEPAKGQGAGERRRLPHPHL